MKKIFKLLLKILKWINIYGQDKDNPVLLYLHGGPCAPTSGYDWSILRKFSADYTAEIISELIKSGRAETIHTTEPDLETVFMELTGKELSK